MIVLKRRILFLLFILTISTFSSASSLFLSDRIENSILIRDNNELNFGISSIDIPINSLDSDRKSKIVSLMNSHAATNNPWYNYYSGLFSSNTSIQRDSYFSSALNNSAQDPGTTWLLFVKFAENDFSVWEEKALEQLEKYIYQSGAEQSVLISQQLLFRSLMLEESGAIKKENTYYKWAQLFNSQALNVYTHASWFYFPHDIYQFLSSISQLFQILIKSWIIQIGMISFAYNILKLWCIVFSISLLTIFLFKYLPVALHSISDMFPSTVPLPLKAILSSAAYCSLISFGILPFMWLSILIISRFLSKKERSLFYSVIVILVCAPLDTHIQTFFSHSLNPDSSLRTFHRSVYEGFSNEKYKTIKNKLKKYPNDKMLLLSATNYALKNTDYTSASNYSSTLNRLYPDDPVVLTTAGNVAFFNNELDQAIELYTSALEIDKSSPEAYYNAGQCYVLKKNSTEGTARIDQASKISPLRVNAFMNKNDKYFSNSTPRLRQIMFADYSPQQFWKSITSLQVYNGEFASAWWGASFAGLPPWPSFFISLVLFTSFIFLRLNPGNQRRIQKKFECRYCGRIICKKCKAGSLCRSCSHSTQFIQNEQALKKIIKTIDRKIKSSQQIFLLFSDILLPGSRNLLQDKKNTLSVLIQLLISSLVITIHVISIRLYLSMSYTPDIYIFIFSAGLLYSIYFTIKNCILIFKEFSMYLKPVEE